MADALFEIDEGDQDDVDATWQTEIKGRIDEIRSGQVEGLTSHEVRMFLAGRRAARRV